MGMREFDWDGRKKVYFDEDTFEIVKLMLIEGKSIKEIWSYLEADGMAKFCAMELIVKARQEIEGRA